MRAKPIEYKHIMDDNAGGYYDQHVYITHRIAAVADWVEALVIIVIGRSCS